jgi:hypothetical protein
VKITGIQLSTGNWIHVGSGYAGRTVERLSWISTPHLGPLGCMDQIGDSIAEFNWAHIVCVLYGD